MIKNKNDTINKFTKRRRNLPHWQSPGSAYFITFRTHKSFILDDKSRDIIYNTILFYDRTLYDLYAFTIMPDHVHIILLPNEKNKNEYIDLSTIMKAIKGYSSKKIKKHLNMKIKQSISNDIIMETSDKIKHIWQTESYDRIIRNVKEYNENIKYILNNAVEKEIVDNGYKYKWFWYKGIDEK